jgi:L-amino acid N-acyltransferase YncA
MMVVRRAGQEDCRDIWEWRNDPLAVGMSVSKDVVPWEAHQKWYAEAIGNSDRVLMIGELSGNGVSEKVGMCRFDLRAADAYVSLNLAPAMRGKGLSARLLRQSIAEVASSSRRRSFLATINRENVPSIRCFERCGFVRCGEEGDFLSYQLTFPTSGSKSDGFARDDSAGTPR